MATMMEHECGAAVTADDMVCPRCGQFLTEASVTAARPGAIAQSGGSAPDGERLCPTDWCRRPLLPGAAVCDGCGRAVAAVAAPAPIAVAAPAPPATPPRFAVILPGSVQLLLTPGVALELGREAGPAVVRAALAALDTVSRRHASLTVTAEGVLVRDLGSSNGTYVDGATVTAAITVRPPAVLRLGQTVSIGLVEGSGHEQG